MHFSNKPIAVAFSGGVDSTAVLHKAVSQNNDVHAIIVDHDLRKESSEEAILCKERAESIGAKAVILKWQHSDITSGIQQRARRARYSLISEYCVENKISEILTGHHYGDVLENVYMRRGKGYLPMALTIKERSYAPVWPEMNGIWLVRPLLNWDKERIIGYCNQNNLKWVEDPSNKSDKYERNRARKDIFNKDYLKTELSQCLEISMQESVPWLEYYRKCLDSIFLDKDSFSVSENLFIRNQRYFGLFLRNAVMCFTSSKSEASLRSYNKLCENYRQGQRKISFGGCIASFTGDKVIVTIQKAKSGQQQKNKCDYFLDRLRKRY